MLELLPCPFCGRPAKIHFNENLNSEFIPRCSAALSCGARGSALHSAEDAQKHWNRRAPTKDWRNKNGN